MKTQVVLSPLQERINRLGRPFVWKRRELSTDIIAELQKLEEGYAIRISQLTEALEQLASQSEAHEDACRELEHTLEQTRAAHDGARAELDERTTAQVVLRLELDAERDSLKALSGSYDELTHDHSETWSRFQLVSDLLATEPASNAGAERFRELLAGDYMRFAETESSLGAEATAQSMLHSIERELTFRASYPDVFQRTIVGIAGGFSSGKSAFINSFIREGGARLPIGIQPVTAIPSYVLATQTPTIRGYSNNGGFVALDESAYRRLSHAFINSFQFDLKAIMPFMCVGVPMEGKHLDNICFVDTPGYNPPTTAGEYTRSDKQAALDYSRQADALIWMIGLDANGTLPNSDLDFLQELGVEQGPIHLVLNKADLKSDDDIEVILDDVEDVLVSNDVPYSGISAYSSLRRSEFACRGESLMEFLERNNQRRDGVEHLHSRVDQVFDMYDTAIRSDVRSRRAKSKAINRLKLDSVRLGGVDLYKEISTAARALTKDLETEELEGWLEESKRLRAAFSEAISVALQLTSPATT